MIGWMRAPGASTHARVNLWLAMGLRWGGCPEWALAGPGRR